jgi:hypothetical protein
VGILDLLKRPTEDPVRREAESLYAALVEEAERAGYPGTIKEFPAAQKILTGTSPDIQLAVIVRAIEDHTAYKEERVDYRQVYLAGQIMASLLKRKIAAPPERVVAVINACANMRQDVMWMPISSVVRLVSAPATPGEIEALQRLHAAISPTDGAPGRKARECIEEVLKGDGPRPLTPGGTWSARVLDHVLSLDAAPRERWSALLAHLLTTADTKPTKKWEAELPALVDAIGRQEFFARAAEWIALGPIPGETKSPIVPERDADYLKGFVWALSTVDEPAVPGLLARLAEQCFKKIPGAGPVSARVGNSCINVLARLDGFEPVAQLGRLRLRVKYVVAQKLIEKAFADAADRAGITPEELEEIAVPTFDLDRDGTRKEVVGDFVAHVRISAIDGAELSWSRQDGTSLKGVPAAIRQDHAADLARLKKAVKDIDNILPAQKARLERLLESNRLIPVEHWRARYCEQPLLRDMSRRVIWLFTQDGRTEPGRMSDGRIVDVNDQPIEWISSKTTACLWHPLGVAPEAVLQWRRRLEHHAIVQPFKQAHREVYILTDAERNTGTYSNRFAAHILRQHQFAALCRERGWRYTLQGQWDSWNMPFRKLPRWNLEIQFAVDPAEEAATSDGGIFSYLSTDQVRFLRDGTPVRLEDIPPLAFSEAMRDVDLFVGVCSVGNDPTWADGGPQQYGEYWHNFAFGELSETAITRSGVLAALIPKLKIADRLSLQDRFLAVRGDLATYKIHLGSGNVMMEPGSRYLCIVPDRGAGPRPTRDVWLPFEGDSGLSIILSKALMLAADTKITDPLIVSQIGRGLS